MIFVFKVASVVFNLKIFLLWHNFNVILKCQSFRKGMNAYLTKHAYKNAFTEDLWDALGEASGKPVRKVSSLFIICLGWKTRNYDFNI